MVKKINNSIKIDFKRCIVEDKLLQVRPVIRTDIPEFCTVWTIEIEPIYSKKFIELVRTNTRDQDPISLQHIKRIRKIKSEEGKPILQCIVCSTDFSNSQREISKLIKFPHSNILCINVPREGPYEKEKVKEWSEMYWPLVWNGDPNDQILNDSVFLMDNIRYYLDIITAKANEAKMKTGYLPVVSLFVDPRSKDRNDFVLVEDRRTHNSNGELALPIDHSIMVGINQVAKYEKSNRLNEEVSQNYLCLNFDVYTTHEPCSMCSMALIHSRINRCIFVREMEKTGCFSPSSGNAYCMHANKKLNSKYEVFQWIGEEYQVPHINDDICA
ncbi:tRNA-specific adenosine deaminase subunit TAD3 [Nakaseomyces bracarensis]|uniref:tRNA-specific adenosine deaminase subunit TAD3 n=1 Tax=Nakaseomyces bracarensis TaxID=273131 RepID=A0ABR4NV59_9SACH